MLLCDETYVCECTVCECVFGEGVGGVIEIL